MIKNKQYFPESWKILKTNGTSDIPNISDPDLFELNATLEYYLETISTNICKLGKFPQCILDRLWIHVYSNEIETPHFHVKFKNMAQCQYDLFTGKPLISEPKEIQKYSKIIHFFYQQHKDDIIAFYEKTIADTAPPQSHIK